MATGWQVVVKLHQSLMFRHGPYTIRPALLEAQGGNMRAGQNAGIGISADMALPSG